MVDAAVAAPLPVRVDKRVELLAIAMRLAGAKEYQVAQHPYALAVDKAFAGFAKHPAIVRTAELRAKGIGFDAPMQLAVALDDKLALTGTDDLDPRWQGIDVPAYVALLQAFAADAKLDAFFVAQRPVYDKAEAQVRAIITDNPVPFYDALFGAGPRHTVVPGMLLGSNNVGVRRGTDFYQVLSTPTLPLLVHEMAHPYINPLFAKHHAALEAAGKAIYPLFAATMRAQNYADWQTMFDEAGVRALVVLYLRQAKGDVAGAAAARDELRAGFVWTNELTEVFRKYQRDGAPDPEAAMPHVIAFFDGLAKQYAGAPPKTPFLGPFDAVMRGDFVVALPSSPAGDYARTLPPFAKRPAVDPSATVEKGKGIVTYGSPATNPMIADIAVTAGWKITPQGIELGAKKLAGEHLVLVATWFRRDDPTRGIAVYAAANDADLVGINHGVRHGMNDWLVARKVGKGYEVVERGDWPFENNAWVPPR